MERSVGKVNATVRDEVGALIEQGEALEKPFIDYAIKAQNRTAPGEPPTLPTGKYEAWYTQALAVTRQLAPDRVADFVEHYRLPKPTNHLNIGNYRLSDAVLGLHIVGVKRENIMAAGAVHLRGQVAILKAVFLALDSTLMDIRTELQAELLDNELDTATDLARAKHLRAAGTVAGVVLERHLRELCASHRIKIVKKKPTMSDFYEALKTAGIIDVPTWRHMQHLGDIRNLCAHDGHREPRKDEVDDMIRDVARIVKTVY